MTCDRNINDEQIIILHVNLIYSSLPVYKTYSIDHPVGFLFNCFSKEFSIDATITNINSRNDHLRKEKLQRCEQVNTFSHITNIFPSLKKPVSED